MRIAYAHFGDQSGVTPHMTAALEALGHEVVPLPAIGPLEPWDAATGRPRVTGPVALHLAAAPTQLVLEASAGRMTLQLDENTKVRIDGREGSAAQIVQGEQARVSFQTSTSSRPTATSVEVSSTGQLPPAGQSQGGMGSSSEPCGSGSSPQQ